MVSDCEIFNRFVKFLTDFVKTTKNARISGENLVKLMTRFYLTFFLNCGIMEISGSDVRLPPGHLQFRESVKTSLNAHFLREKMLNFD